jgi:uncharacterized protein (DUF2141 family)
MKKFITNSVLLISLSILLINCANRGRPSGGETDSTPPTIVRSSPENFSTNFKADEIKIYFDEYVKIKNQQKQLIISPPMDTEPLITPQGSASKYITIKILDTLEANTTYTFNFGQSIVDNNESNPYSFYKYVFSTGNTIDSLYIKGTIAEAVNLKTDDFVSILLYEVDSNYTDSIIYKKRPKYVTNTLDSTTNFTLENLKAGTYKMIALKDENSDYKFQQKTDKIGFLKSFITVPNDTIYELKLFKEAIDFKVARSKLISGQKIAFGFEGDSKNMLINLLSEAPDNFKSRITKDSKTDSLMYWYKPKLEVDSLMFLVGKQPRFDTLTVRIRDMLKDSLTLISEPRGTIKFDQDFYIEGSIPFTKIASEKVTVLDKDSVSVNFTTKLDSLNNRYIFNFNKTEGNNYKIQFLPEAFMDFFGNTNDTLNVALKTKTLSDYGNARIALANVTYPVIIQLTDEKGEIVKYEAYATEANPIDFKNLDSGKYRLRVILDTNKNKKFDTGKYLLKRQPERISYFPKTVEVRAGWDEEITFTLE